MPIRAPLPLSPLRVAVTGLPPSHAAALSAALRRLGLEVEPQLPPTAFLSAELGRVVVTGLGSRAQRQAVLRLCSHHPDALVVAFVAKTDDESVEQALLLGAVAVVEATDPVEDAAHVIAEAIEGLTCLPVNVVRHLVRAALPRRELTREELDLLRGIAQSSSIAELARTSNRSRSATYAQLAAVRMALGVTDNHEAVRWATRRGLL
jgi:DNA-binding NarL/FixJ family response regulator